jgi:chromosome partitioning protein
MDVIVVASQKGGGGKTTLSGHLAVEAERLGDGPVALIDTDPQGSLSDWWNSRVAETPLLASLKHAQLGACLESLRRGGTRFVFIDTPPAFGPDIGQTIRTADLVLIPTRPSPHDIRAIGRTTQLVEAAAKPMIFVVNGGTPRGRLTAETAIALSQHGTVSPVILHHRVDFASSMIDGMTAGEANPSGSSAREIAALWDYVKSRLRKSTLAQMEVAANA